MSRHLVVFLSLSLVCASSQASDPVVLSGSLVDINGRQHPLASPNKGGVTVLLFLGTECPVSNSYAPEYQRQATNYAERGVRYFGVHCDPDVSAEVAQKHAQEYALKFPLALDHTQHWARLAGVQTMPTAVVLNAQGEIIYRGRIDNRYTLEGKRRVEATEHNLRDAVAAVLEGRSPQVAQTPVFGCPLPRRRD